MNLFEEGLRRYLTMEQLQRIQACRVGIGGAGGLGSNAAMILVRSGFRQIEIIDYDVIDPSNLNRQQYFPNEVGRLKVDVLGERLAAINPDLELRTHAVQWSSETGSRYFIDADIIVEAFDQADGKFRFVEFYQPTGKPLISGVGMAGLQEKQPLSVKRMGNIYFVGDRCTDSHQGHPPMAPRVTACAAMMAEIALDLALDPAATRATTTS